MHGVADTFLGRHARSDSTFIRGSVPYQLRTFGGLDLRGSDGEPVEPILAHSKGMALLVYLAVEAVESGIARSKVAALLWPDREEQRARNALRSTLTRMRQAADVSPLEGKGERALRPAWDQLEADVCAFREALGRGDPERALELYRGDFLAGFQVADAPPFERWADEQRERLRDEAHEAAVSVGQAARASGDLEAATEAFRRALELRPFREEGALGLVRTLAERGRTAEALQCFEAFRARREEELELAPSEELQALVERIRSGDVARADESERVGSGPELHDEAPEEENREAGEPGKSVQHEEGPTESGPWRHFGLLAGATLVLAAGALGLWQLLGPEGEPATTAAGDRSVAVLPFEAIGTEDPGSIAAGLHSDLLTRLSNVSALEVVSGTSVNRFRDAALPLPVIADSLGVTWVVEGEVQRSGGAIEIHVQLIDPSTDTHAWAETYRRELTAASLFDLQGEISRSVARALATRIADAEGRRLGHWPTENLEAYRFYVRGRSLMEQRFPAELLRALEYFDQALAVDSSYALAWAGRANALSHLARRSGFEPDTLLPAAREATERALQLKPDLAEASVAMGRLRMYGGDAPAALRAFERAIELRPSYAAAHVWLAKLQLSIGRPGAALEHGERAVQLDPLSRENYGTLVWALVANGRYVRALAVARRASELRSGLRDGTGHPPGDEMIALSHLGRLDEMEAHVAESELAPDQAPIFAMSAAAAGDTANAVAMLSRIATGDAPTFAGFLHAALGHEDRALTLLRERYPRTNTPWDSWGSIHLRYFWPEILGPLREEPGFEALMADIDRHWGLSPDAGLPDSVDAADGSHAVVPAPTRSRP